MSDQENPQGTSAERKSLDPQKIQEVRAAIVRRILSLICQIGGEPEYKRLSAILEYLPQQEIDKLKTVKVGEITIQRLNGIEGDSGYQWEYFEGQNVALSDYRTYRKKIVEDPFLQDVVAQAVHDVCSPKFAVKPFGSGRRQEVLPDNGVIERRRFLQWSAGVVGLSGIAKALNYASGDQMPIVDVIANKGLIAGGLTGLYHGWKMLPQTMKEDYAALETCGVFRDQADELCNKLAAKHGESIDQAVELWIMGGGALGRQNLHRYRS